jgi:polysaccharide deacetylase family protein (PEP-CTERM system associated)
MKNQNDSRKKQINAMSVDVEDYFQVAAFENQISVDDWDSYALRVEGVTRVILGAFKKNNVKATFFVLGWIAERMPNLIRDIVSDGHELASHGYWHQKAFMQTPDEFLDDIVQSKRVLEAISGVEVLGYRAPSFSIDSRNEWAFDLLKRAGYQYSSSTYPISHDHYGTPDWPTSPFRLDNGLLEIPQATIELLGRRLPVGGGGFFRLFPMLLNRFFVKKFHEQHENPYVFYFHPWEMDVGQPKVKGISLKSRFRHYINQSRMERKVRQMCERYEWVTISDAHMIKSNAKRRAV